MISNALKCVGGRWGVYGASPDPSP